MDSSASSSDDGVVVFRCFCSSESISSAKGCSGRGSSTGRRQYPQDKAQYLRLMCPGYKKLSQKPREIHIRHLKTDMIQYFLDV